LLRARPTPKSFSGPGRLLSLWLAGCAGIRGATPCTSAPCSGAHGRLGLTSRHSRCLGSTTQSRAM
jgi:hypothetical protein